MKDTISVEDVRSKGENVLRSELVTSIVDAELLVVALEPAPGEDAAKVGFTSSLRRAISCSCSA